MLATIFPRASIKRTLSIEFLLMLSLISILLGLDWRACADEGVDELNRRSVLLYQQVLSPYCPGRSLNDCPSSEAHRLKDEMKGALASGVPEDQVLEGVFARIGDKYRAIPPFAGFGRMVWFLPFAFIAFGLGVIAFIVLRGKGRATKRSSTLSPDLQSRIDRELSEI